MTTIQKQIEDNDDDGWQNAAGVIAGIDSNTDLAIGILSTGSMWARWRWTGFEAAAGGTIDSSTRIHLYVLNTTNDDLVANFYFEAADSAAALTGSASEISGKPRTTNFQAVNATSIGAGTWYYVTGADLAAAAQEVTSRPGWDGSLAAILDALPGIAFDCRDFSGNSAQAGILELVYTPAAGGVPIKQIQYARVRG